MDLSTLNAMQRVYSELLRLAVPDAAVESVWIVRPLPSERDIASRANTTRETVSRAIGRLRNADIVKKMKGKNLYILDRARLEQIKQTLEVAIGT